MNHAILIGRLGKAPELRFTPQGKAVARFSVATSRAWKDQDGERQEKTTWHNIVVWGAQAEACGKYLDKGSRVAVTGEIENRQYEKDGEKRWTSEIIAQHVEFLSSKPDTRGDGGEEAPF